MKKVALIGGSGFIATNFLHLLKQKQYLIHIFDIVEPDTLLENCTFSYLDIRDGLNDYSILADFDYLYLFAALLGKQCKENPENGWKTNIFGITNILNQLIKHKRKPVIIYTSTCMVYDDGSGAIPYHEYSPLKGKELYEISKIYGEAFIQSCCKAFGFTGIVFRFFTVYGPGPASAQKGHFISTWIERAINNEPLIIFGEGEQTIDLTHVQDVSKALELVLSLDLKPGDYEIINIATGTETKINEIASWFKVVKPDVTFNYNPTINTFSKRKVGDIQKAKRLLAYVPTVEPQAGLLSLLKEKLC